MFYCLYKAYLENLITMFPPSDLAPPISQSIVGSKKNMVEINLPSQVNKVKKPNSESFHYTRQVSS